MLQPPSHSYFFAIAFYIFSFVSSPQAPSSCASYVTLLQGFHCLLASFAIPFALPFVTIMYLSPPHFPCLVFFFHFGVFHFFCDFNFLQYFSFHIFLWFYFFYNISLFMFFCYNLGLQSSSLSTSFVTFIQSLHHFHSNFKFFFLLICLVASLISQCFFSAYKVCFFNFYFCFVMCFVLFTCVLLLLHVDSKFGIVILKKNLSRI